MLVSKYQPAVPVVCLTGSARSARRVILKRGVFTDVRDLSSGNCLEEFVADWLRQGFLQKGETVLSVFAEDHNQAPNVIRVIVA